MPIAAPIIAALITAGTAATEIGLQASGAFSPGGPSQADIQRQNQEAQQKQLQTQEQQAFKRFAPDVQAQTGGSLAQPSFSSMVAELSGAPADLNLAQSTIFGSGPASTGGGMASMPQMGKDGLSAGQPLEA